MLLEYVIPLLILLIILILSFLDNVKGYSIAEMEKAKSARSKGELPNNTKLEQTNSNSTKQFKVTEQYNAKPTGRRKSQVYNQQYNENNYDLNGNYYDSSNQLQDNNSMDDEESDQSDDGDVYQENVSKYTNSYTPPSRYIFANS
jgi:hypothetical protein